MKRKNKIAPTIAPTIQRKLWFKKVTLEVKTSKIIGSGIPCFLMQIEIALCATICVHI
jgi:hypothetical protein